MPFVLGAGAEAQMLLQLLVSTTRRSASMQPDQQYQTYPFDNPSFQISVVNHRRLLTEFGDNRAGALAFLLAKPAPEPP